MRMDFRETGWEGVNLMALAEYSGQCRAVVNMVMNLRFLQKARHFLIS
jgi:hypothetical protein